MVEGEGGTGRSHSLERIFTPHENIPAPSVLYLVSNTSTRDQDSMMFPHDPDQPQPSGQAPYGQPQGSHGAQPPHGQPYPQQPYGQPQPPAKKERKWPWAVGGVVLVLIVAGMVGGGDLGEVHYDGPVHGLGHGRTCRGGDAPSMAVVATIINGP
ncbi:hypothetical protein SRABI91_02642 [Rhodococcoides fascians]|nr:hypothetical protein SRABI91_02642 [Rhodococcus fascians]